MKVQEVNLAGSESCVRWRKKITSWQAVEILGISDQIHRTNDTEVDQSRQEEQNRYGCSHPDHQCCLCQSPPSWEPSYEAAPARH